MELKNSLGQKFRFGVNEQNQAFVDRSEAGFRDFSESFASEWYSKISAPRFYDGPWKLELVFDRSACELFLDHGTRYFSQVVYPDAPYTGMEISGNGTAVLQRLKD